MIKMVVFDMAGTTIHENNVVYHTLKNTLDEFGFPLSIEKVLSIAGGKEKKTAILDLIKSTGSKPVTDKKLETIYDRFIGNLNQSYDKMEISPASGLDKVFEFLKENKISIVLNTGYNTFIANKLLKRVQLSEILDFDLLVTADMVNRARPYPDMINYALEFFQIHATSCIKVGDSTVDIQEGINAGCRYSIGITTGAQNFYELSTVEPSFIIDELTELIPIIKRANEE